MEFISRIILESVVNASRRRRRGLFNSIGHTFTIHHRTMFHEFISVMALYGPYFPHFTNLSAISCVADALYMKYEQEPNVEG